MKSQKKFSLFSRFCAISDFVVVVDVVAVVKLEREIDDDEDDDDVDKARRGRGRGVVESEKNLLADSSFCGFSDPVKRDAGNPDLGCD